MYKYFLKRVLDFFISLIAIIILSPVFLTLSIIGLIALKGNPFFTQQRPGKKEKIFKMIKFRTMNNAKDQYGKLLPDVQRITSYGAFLRKTSLDELPELINIFIGDMAIVGPRPLLVKYLPLYSEEQRHRHDVRPGLTGYAQVHGRNGVSWTERFSMDVYYVQHITLRNDIRIILDTIKTVVNHEGINTETTSKYTMEEFTGNN